MSAGLTLDAGALVALDRDDRRAWAFLKAYVADKVVPVVPAPVVAEVWRSGRQARLARALGSCRVEELDEALARRAGELCGRAGTDDPVDAVVAASAARRGDVVLTSGPRDLGLLASHLPGTGVVVLPVASV